MKKKRIFIVILLCFSVVVIWLAEKTKDTDDRVVETAGMKEVNQSQKTATETADPEDDTEMPAGSYWEEYSVYNNPIDQYYLPQIYSWDASQVEIREAQDAYREAWKAEYQNLMDWLREKCIYDEDRANIRALEKNIAAQVEIEKQVLGTELTDAYEVNPDPEQITGDFTRNSLPGNGTRSRLNECEGEIYRDVSMRIIDMYCWEEERYEFRFREPKMTKEPEAAKGAERVESPGQETGDGDFHLEGIKIPVSDVFGENWGGQLVENTEYYFYIRDGAIVRLDKKTWEETIIMECQEEGNGQRVLYLSDHRLYYVNQTTNDIYSVDFTGKGQKQIISGRVLKHYDAAMKNPAVLGFHIYKEEVYLLLSAYEVVHYDAKQKKMEQIAFDARDGWFTGDSFYFLQRRPSPVYRTDWHGNKEIVVNKNKDVTDILVLDNRLYYSMDEKIYRYYQDKKDMLFHALSDGQEFIEFVPAKDMLSYVYCEDDNLYLAWENSAGKDWNHIKLPEDYYAAGCMIDGVLFYEAVDLQDEDEETLPFYQTMRISAGN